LSQTSQQAVVVGAGDLTEIQNLLLTAGVKTVTGIKSGKFVDPDYYLGSGKISELDSVAKLSGANLVVIDNNLLARQERNLEKKLRRPVIDRTAVILDIFALKANSFEGKLQVEKAILEYNLTRVQGLWPHLERLGGGIGTRGPGESQIETDRRLIRNKINDINKRIVKIENNRHLKRKLRDKLAIKKIALVGYTNSGKTSLFNYLTDQDKPVADKLFETLSPKTSKFLINKREYLLTDTVGFINKLPHSLIEAFKATLEEALEADLLIEMVDSSALIENQIDSTNRVLDDLDLGNKPRIRVFNKIDQLTNSQLQDLYFSYPDDQFVSTEAGFGLETLKKEIDQFFLSDLKEESFLIGYKNYHKVDQIIRRGLILETKYLNDGVFLRALI